MKRKTKQEGGHHTLQNRAENRASLTRAQTALRGGLMGVVKTTIMDKKRMDLRRKGILHKAENDEV